MTTLWRIDDEKLTQLDSDTLKLEKNIHDWIEQDPSMLDPDLMIIGREVRTSANKRIDLLGVNPDGNLVIIELKKDQAHREVVAQTLEYASWVATLKTPEVIEIAQRYLKSKGQSDFEGAFRARFDSSLPEKLNTTHTMFIVATSLDEASKTIVEYLSQRHDVPINTAFFNVFSDGGKQYLSADWLMDQEQVVERNAEKTSAPWGGIWYVNIKEGDGGRQWQDMCEFGFVSAGGDRHWSDPLNKLEQGSELYAHVTGIGYVGYGIVQGPCIQASEFRVGDKSLLDLSTKGNYAKNSDNPDKAEYVVPVKWISKFSKAEAKKFPGYFASTHVVCKLRKQDTLDFLKAEFASVPHT